jgi:hypothetical protein
LPRPGLTPEQDVLQKSFGQRLHDTPAGSD